MNPTWKALPDFLKKNAYADVEDKHNSPWQTGWNTDKEAFEWMLTEPEHMGYAMPWMMSQRAGMPTWWDVFPFEEDLKAACTPETVTFVDVGGAMGHQCMAFKQRFPHLQGRVILQDLPQVIARVPKIDGVEAMGHDFWTPQPLKGK